MKRLLVILLLSIASFGSAYAYTPKEVNAALAAGDYPQAEQMLREVMAQRDSLVEPHYMLADVLYHEHHLGAAHIEFDRAEALRASSGVKTPAVDVAHIKNEIDSAPYLPSDVQEAMDASDLSGAEQMVRLIIAAHPAFAKPHYVLSQVLYYEHKLDEANSELAMAESMKLHLDDMSAFDAFKGNLESALASQAAAQAVAASNASSSQPPANTVVSSGATLQSAADSQRDVTGVGRTTQLRDFDPLSPAVMTAASLVFFVVLAIFLIRMSKGAGSSGSGRGYGQQQGSGGSGQSPVYYEESHGHSTGTILAAGVAGVALGEALSHRDQDDTYIHNTTINNYNDGIARPDDSFRDSPSQPLDLGSNSWGDTGGSTIDTGGSDNSWT